IRPRMKGPRSSIRTTTDRPLARLWTRTSDPKGSLRCAAVSAFGLLSLPLAVRPFNAYQEALPHSAGEAVAQEGRAAAASRATTSAILGVIFASIRFPGKDRWDRRRTNDSPGSADFTTE